MAQRKKRDAAAKTKGKGKSVDDDNTGLVQVKLDDGQWRGRADELASELKRKETTLAKKKAAVTKFNSELKLHDERIAVLAEEVDTHSALVDPQIAMNYRTGNRSLDRENGFGDEDAEPAAAANDSDSDDSDDDAPPANVAAIGRRSSRGNGAAAGAGT
jgi:hypothetical protein